MHLVYSEHAIKRMKQRGITQFEIEELLKYPEIIRKSFGERKEAIGVIRNKRIKIKFIEKENYIIIITLLTK